MRDWQKSIEVKTEASGTEQVSDSKANIDTEKSLSIFSWSIATFILSFFLLYILRPPFIETQEKQKLFEEKKLSWVSITIFSFAASLIVALLSSFLM
jgi:hypothetical protein